MIQNDYNEYEKLILDNREAVETILSFYNRKMSSSFSRLSNSLEKIFDDHTKRREKGLFKIGVGLGLIFSVAFILSQTIFNSDFNFSLVSILKIIYAFVISSVGLSLGICFALAMIEGIHHICFRPDDKTKLNMIYVVGRIYFNDRKFEIINEIIKEIEGNNDREDYRLRAFLESDISLYSKERFNELSGLYIDLSALQTTGIENRDLYIAHVSDMYSI